MTVHEDLLVEAGATYSHRIAAAGLEGAEVRGEIRVSPSAAAAVYEWPAADLPADADGVEVRIPAAVSAVWGWAVAVYQIDARLADDTVVRVARGSVILNPWPIFPPPGAEPLAALVPPFYPPAYPQGV